jgi:hypothetical protein
LGIAIAAGLVQSLCFVASDIAASIPFDGPEDTEKLAPHEAFQRDRLQIDTKLDWRTGAWPIKSGVS